jgi:hypothetical protein
MSANAFYMDDNEELLLKIRKHWFLVMVELLPLKAGVALPFLVLLAFPTLLTGEVARLTLMCLSAWLLLCIIGVATIWTNYYLDVWVVTDKRIVNLEQISLFHREVTTMRMERIQDTTIEIPGFLASFFDFGNLTVHSAGEHMKSQTFEGIPHPEDVKRIVLDRVDCVTEHKSKLEFSEHENPNHGV